MLTQPHNIRAKIGDQWKTVGNIRPKDGKPGFSVGLTADLVQLLVNHKDGWVNFDLLPDDGQRRQRHAGDDNTQDVPW